MKAKATVVHLVNYTGGMKRPIERAVPLHGLSRRCRRPVRSARALVSGKALRVRKDGTVALPPVGGFEVVVLKD